MWLLGFELRTFRRAVGCSYPLSHLTSLPLNLKHKFSTSNVQNSQCLIYIYILLRLYFLFLFLFLFIVKVMKSRLIWEMGPWPRLWLCLDWGGSISIRLQHSQDEDLGDIKSRKASWAEAITSLCSALGLLLPWWIFNSHTVMQNKPSSLKLLLPEYFNIASEK